MCGKIEIAPRSGQLICDFEKREMCIDRKWRRCSCHLTCVSGNSKIYLEEKNETGGEI